AVPSLVQAQENAPFPLPRPTDRVPEGWSPAAAAETEAPADVEVAPLPADQATNAAAAAAAVALDPQPVTLTAQITEDGASIPEGIVWRIFDTKTDASGELALAAKSDEATAHVRLAP